MERVEIDPHKQLAPGDVIELHFKTVGITWLRAAQLAVLDSQLENRPEFRVINHSTPDKQTLIFKVRILKTNPIFVTAAVIGGIIIATSFMAWLLLDKVYQIMDSPAGKIAVGGFGSLAAVAAIAAVLALLPKSRT